MEPALSVLDTEKVNPATTAIDHMSPLEIVQVINAEDMKVAQAVQQALPHIARAIEAIATKLRLGGRLIYTGAGTSGRLGALDAYECPPTFNIAPTMVVACLAGGQQALDKAYEDYEDNWEAGQADMAAIGHGVTKLLPSRSVLERRTAEGKSPVCERYAVSFRRPRSCG
jgi:N-acetylmuramic acid 6-phosphate etherase